MEATTRGGNSILGFKGTRPGARVGAAMFQVRGFGRPKFSRVVLLLCLSGFSLIRMFEVALCSCFVYLFFFEDSDVRSCVVCFVYLFLRGFGCSKLSRVVIASFICFIQGFGFSKRVVFSLLRLSGFRLWYGLYSLLVKCLGGGGSMFKG